jgi:hypothetical protein
MNLLKRSGDKELFSGEQSSKENTVKLKKITDFFKKDILKCDINKELSSKTIVEENIDCSKTEKLKGILKI